MNTLFASRLSAGIVSGMSSTTRTRQPALLESDRQVKSRLGAQTSRQDRLTSQAFLREITKNARVASCMLGTVNGEVTVRCGINASGKRTAGAKGLITCGSVWACPVCSFKISQQRATDLSKYFTEHRANGGTVLFATFTLRHDRTQSLETVWDALGDAWRAVGSGRGWQDLKEEYGLVGAVRAVETTHGANGWHVHLHTAIFIEKDAHVDVNALQVRLFERWNNGLAKSGFSAEAAHGVDIRRTYSDSGLARYLNKGSNLASEVALGQHKTAKKSSRTPFAILADLAKTGQVSCACKGARTVADRCDLCLWREFEKTSSGRKQLTIPRNLSALIQLSDVEDDADEAILEPVDLIKIKALAWRELMRLNLAGALYATIENDGLINATEMLDYHGIGWTVCNTDIPSELLYEPRSF